MLPVLQANVCLQYSLSTNSFQVPALTDEEYDSHSYSDDLEVGLFGDDSDGAEDDTSDEVNLTSPISPKDMMSEPKEEVSLPRLKSSMTTDIEAAAASSPISGSVADPVIITDEEAIVKSAALRSEIPSSVIDIDSDDSDIPSEEADAPSAYVLGDTEAASEQQEASPEVVSVPDVMAKAVGPSREADIQDFDEQERDNDADYRAMIAEVSECEDSEYSFGSEDESELCDDGGSEFFNHRPQAATDDAAALPVDLAESIPSVSHHTKVPLQLGENESSGGRCNVSMASIKPAVPSWTIREASPSDAAMVKVHQSGSEDNVKPTCMSLSFNPFEASKDPPALTPAQSKDRDILGVMYANKAHLNSLRVMKETHVHQRAQQAIEDHSNQFQADADFLKKVLDGRDDATFARMSNSDESQSQLDCTSFSRPLHDVCHASTTIAVNDLLQAVPYGLQSPSSAHKRPFDYDEADNICPLMLSPDQNERPVAKIAASKIHRVAGSQRAADVSASSGEANKSDPGDAIDLPSSPFVDRIETCGETSTISSSTEVRPVKRLKRVAEALCYAAAGGVAVGAGLFSILVATAPDFA